MEERQTLKAITVLLRASQSIQDVVKQEVAEYGLNPTEFSVLELLYHKGDQPIQTIGKKVLLTSGSMTYIVDRLEAKGYLIRKACPSDRRVTYVALTEEGRTLMSRIFPAHEQRMDELFDGLDLANTITQLKTVGKRAEASKNFN
ncbi:MULTISPECIES: MarR family winged helix-turn-helix transcriptional regulator [unclassified Exiguobacterium]|uniref:MarR family winged helix-turn-helix transcriptional regulator n=1 Tax=unclassified Exiguobacterium TaxID=2644629 RepID=UPI00103C7C97|nr:MULTISPECIES: MarR family transcriptional regulator [unclassified Exiguobacterium]TCI69166.1 MarR family transcriptional regulator [Exiguobacterium sp. IPCI3]TCI78625.1 MarR family transcriptional regulator [Exiguobacterium sp. IPCH1]TCI81129.1 MarR family transcriptional regulator [Exiguobacterium sp. IPBC4]